MQTRSLSYLLVANSARWTSQSSGRSGESLEDEDESKGRVESFALSRRVQGLSKLGSNAGYRLYGYGSLETSPQSATTHSCLSPSSAPDASALIEIRDLEIKSVCQQPNSFGANLPSYKNTHEFI
ncbi:6788_t:CDS:2 [Acaulospora colombiana]|uniref:6788_t:CDS:1 n=1 Tax=Acaulospora colombiana TaxID=27376 RepID=A0ACA9ML24_9GLOM|nr:6788_t:CDS:2 [Acaulospora colombiana]